MCGIVGAFNIPDSYKTVTSMADSLPHRGENGAGIFLGNNTGDIYWERNEFDITDLIRKTACHNYSQYNTGIAHVRYGTAGDRRSLVDTQPLGAKKMPWGGYIYYAHNGDSPYMEEDRSELISQGSVFTTSSDSELILHYIGLSGDNNSLTAIREGLKRYRGTYALIMIVKDADGLKLVAVRDPSGNRPLSLGKLGDGYVLASEDSAFEIVEASFIRDILPGEILVISESGLSQNWIQENNSSAPLRQCIYENNYFSLPTSEVFGIPVGEFREVLGRRLAKRYGHLIKPGDIITYVPDSANFFAQGFCDEIDRKLKTLFIRRHSTRSFTQESQKVIDDTLRRKFSFRRSKIKRLLKTNPNTRVWVIDDSIVRGNTSRKITRAFRGYGVKWIGWLSGSPAIIGPCHKGIDMPGKEGKLIAIGRMKSELLSDDEKIAQAIEADFVGYLPLQDLRDTVRVFEKDRNDFCYGCFENHDPIWNKW